MKNALLTISLFLGIAGFQPAKAFDGEFSLTPPRLLMENFLDIKAYELQAVEQRNWKPFYNGFRMTGGSLDKERAYLETEFHLTESLSQRLSASIHFEDSNFHYPKPTPLPLAELAWGHKNWQIAFLGTPVYDKRQADLGWAFILGEYGKNFIRASVLSVDHYYNHKNDYDNSRYLDHALEWRLIAHLDRKPVRINLDLQRTPPFTFQFDAGDLFHYRDWFLSLNGEYQWQDRFVGVRLRGDKNIKDIQDGVLQDQYQQRFVQGDVYIDNLRWKDWPVTLGLRYDRFVYTYDRQIALPNQQNFYLKTAQLYGIIKMGNLQAYHADLGLYLGRIRSRIDDDVDTSKQRNLVDWQAKLRTGMAVKGPSGKLTLNISFNLDRIVEDPLDGGGISYQRFFQ